MRKPCRAGSVVASALLAGTVAVAARADDLSISTATTTPVVTATAANNSPGNVTIVVGGSVAVTSGAAATINSPNTLTNGGGIANTGTSGPIGVVITGGGPVTFANNAAVTLGTTGGSGGIGVSLTGLATSGTITFGTTGSVAVAGDNAIGVALAAPFTGTIGLRAVSVTGATSTAVALTAPLTGSLTLTGATTATTAGSTAVLVAAPISGTVTNGGSVSAGTVRSLDSSGNPVAGTTPIAGVRVSAGLGGGFVNDRYYIDANGVAVPAASVDTTVDTLVTGSIVATGSAPALWVAPDPASPQAITLGAVGTGDDGYGIVDRGVIQSSVADVGLAATALRVGGGGATTTLAGGIITQANASILATSLDARATAIDLLAGAVVPQVTNRGNIAASTTAVAAAGSTPVGPGGPAFGIVVEPGATLGTIVNTGIINALAVGKNNGATAILDLAGTVGAITNSGTISTTVSFGGGGAARAIDLSAGTGAVTVTNSGTITGAVVLGNGPTTLALTGGTVSGPVTFGASATNLFAVSGTGVYAGTLTTPAPIAVTLADTARLGLVGGPATLASLSATGAATLVVPVVPGGASLVVTGAASFTGASTVSLALQSLALAQTLTIITAAGGLTTDHLATLVDASSAPYLFTATAPTLTPTSLGIALTRKTAAQIGLTGGQGALFDASITALANNSPEAAAIANLPNQAAVLAAYRQITPPSFGRAQLRVAQQVADTGFGAAAERLAVVTDRGRAPKAEDLYGIGLWAQEYGDFNRQAAGPNEGTFNTSAFGIAGGVDTTHFAHSVLGIGFVTNFATIHHDPVAGEPGFNVPSTTTGVEPYAAFTFKPFFVEATGLFAHVGYSAKRTLTIGAVTDTVQSNWNGTELGAGINVGARFAFGPVRITPSNALSWTSLRQDAYTEQGAGAFGLAVARQTDTATTDTAKLALALVHAMGEGLLKLELHGGFTHQFNLKPTDTVASFVSSSTVIELPGDTAKADEHSYGVDLGYTQDTIAIRGGYDRREAAGFRDQLLAVTATIGF